jgi:hypothetical protein
MDREELFAQWAPMESPWSAWAKPVLFAHVSDAPLPLDVPAPADDWRALDVAWAPLPSDRTAIVVDLQGVGSVRMGLALAARGHRPVPLYNCCPGPNPVLQVRPIEEALRRGAVDLAALRLDPNAPPAFLLDADRLSAPGRLAPGMFDNRWMTFPQDFPSANFLASQGITTALVVQTEVRQPSDDLRHVLLRWQEAGIGVLQIGTARGGQPQRLLVDRPSRFRWVWYRALAALGLRRNSAGGFGSVIPHPSSGGGFS